MTSESVYLKPDVVSEPLFNQWYAWPYLISPVTSAIYVANSHLKIMRSFVASPQVHVAALKNAAMLGGPFINYDAARAGEISELINKTVKEQGPMLELAEAIKSLDEMLQNEAVGHSLEPLYEKVPEPLKGYVELVYDMHNRPSFRLIEGLLYKSRYYNTDSQSIALYVAHEESRTFALSSPKLAGAEQLHIPLPFNSAAYDELFSMRHTPQPLSHIKSLLGVADEDDELFASFFTTKMPRAGDDYAGDGVRIRYFGHACLLVESDDVSILVDPVISYQSDEGMFRYTYDDLPAKIDYVLITHNHQDHCIFEVLLQLRHKIRHIVVPKSNGEGLLDPSLKLVLKNIGFASVHEIDELEEITVAGGSITGLPFLGEHGDLNIRSKGAYVIKLRGRSIMCAADSNNIEPRLYDHIHRCVGDVDVLFLGMECDGAPLSWLYGPLLTRPLARKLDQSRRLDGSNCEKGLNIVSTLNPRHVYIYAMGQEPWLTFLTSIQYTDESRPIVESDKLVEQCRRRDIETERLFGQKEIFLPPAN
ncbi:MAG TPA: MBL fold metallo-hydrolase [Pyrinomonadaceae bacterium]|jgi:L-ascorbate metabolism protein UlaG (beta-lactamase superfamily)|nr:MBL fold metallo-hydrolase [Pyrinomonadaceae bacterium]